MDISIIVPFYHGNKYMERLMKCLSKTVDKAKSEFTDLEVELVIVNDSPDCELQFDKSNLSKNIVFKEFVNQQNMGIHKSRVNGLNASNGKYVFFLIRMMKLQKISSPAI